MTVTDIMNQLELEIVAGKDNLLGEVTGGFVGDLLSVVMGKAKEGDAWITIQSHVNIVAVALLTGCACIIVSEGFDVEQEAIDKANDEQIPIFVTKKSSYQIANELGKALDH